MKIEQVYILRILIVVHFIGCIFFIAIFPLLFFIADSPSTSNAIGWSVIFSAFTCSPSCLYGMIYSIKYYFLRQFKKALIHALVPFGFIGMVYLFTKIFGM